MTSQPTCPTCGGGLPAAGSTCPRCLMALGARSAPASTGAPLGGRVPEIEELAPHFPGLELLDVLGRGGMGVVYRARQRDLDREVALKVLLPECTQDPAFAERFEREARVLARLDHPHVVRVLDAGHTEGWYWFAMEFVDGVNLRKLIEEREVSPREALSVVTQVCDALQFAHDQGVVHRDIKPENILLDRLGRVKIADFGLAKLVGRELDGITLTRSDQAMGTPQYMAPEQIRKPLTVDHRADLYSLGVVLYELLTGDLPMGNFPLPSDRVGIDVRLDEVVLKSLEREPERRYQQASDVKVDVEGATQASEARQPERCSRDSGRRKAKRGPGLGVLLGVGCLLVVLVPVAGLLLYGVTATRYEEARAVELTHQALEAERAPDRFIPFPAPLEEREVPESFWKPSLLESERGGTPNLEALKLRGRNEKLEMAGLAPSGFTAKLRQAYRRQPMPSIDHLSDFEATMRARYAAVESAHLVEVNFSPGVTRLVIAPFELRELEELERALHAGIANQAPQAYTSEQLQELALEVFPFGWCWATLELTETEDGWSWWEAYGDERGREVWRNERRGTSLPPRLRRVLANLPEPPEREAEEAPPSGLDPRAR